VDLNADMGEWSGAELPETERELLHYVTTAHVACGAHAGGRDSMHRTVAAAVAAGVVVGAHPAYPDREHFGRAPMALDAQEVAALVLDQVATLSEVARAEGTTVRSVKPHGALYHRLATDEETAEVVADAIGRIGRDLVMVVPANSETGDAFHAAGIATVAEGFCDRAYRPDGSLVSRAEPGALLTIPADAASQALTIALDGRARAVDGSTVQVRCESLCVHGDTPGAPAIARRVREVLEAHGVGIASFVGAAGAVDGGQPGSPA